MWKNKERNEENTQGDRQEEEKETQLKKGRGWRWRGMEKGGQKWGETGES